jgi:hypothetical protein
LVLRALAAEAKSCALVNLFMICPQWSAGGLADHDEISPLITAISWRTTTHGNEPTREAAMAAFAKSWRRGIGPPCHWRGRVVRSAGQDSGKGREMAEKG